MGEVTGEEGEGREGRSMVGGGGGGGGGGARRGGERRGGGGRRKGRERRGAGGKTRSPTYFHLCSSLHSQHESMLTHPILEDPQPVRRACPTLKHHWTLQAKCTSRHITNY